MESITKHDEITTVRYKLRCCEVATDTLPSEYRGNCCITAMTGTKLRYWPAESKTVMWRGTVVNSCPSVTINCGFCSSV